MRGILAATIMASLVVGCRGRERTEQVAHGVHESLDPLQGFEPPENVERASSGWYVLSPRTDLPPLRDLVWLPSGVTACRWIAELPPSAYSRVPGPTDTDVFAFVQLSAAGWAELGDLKFEEPRLRGVSPEVARALFPGRLAAPGDAHDGFQVVAATITGSRIRSVSGAILVSLERVDDGLFVNLELR